MSLNAIQLAILAALAFAACAWASAGEADLSACQAHGQSRGTCIHSVLP